MVAGTMNPIKDYAEKEICIKMNNWSVESKYATQVALVHPEIEPNSLSGLNS